MMTPLNIQSADSGKTGLSEMLAPEPKPVATRNDFFHMMAQALSPRPTETAADDTAPVAENISGKTDSKKKLGDEKNLAEKSDSNANSVMALSAPPTAPAKHSQDLPKSGSNAENVAQSAVPNKLERAERPARKSAAAFPVKAISTKTPAGIFGEGFPGSISSASDVAPIAVPGEASAQPNVASVPQIPELNPKLEAAQVAEQTSAIPRDAVPFRSNVESRTSATERRVGLFQKGAQRDEVSPKNTQAETASRPVSGPSDTVSAGITRHSVRAGAWQAQTRHTRSDASYLDVDVEVGLETHSKADDELAKTVFRAPHFREEMVSSPRELPAAEQKNELIGISESDSANPKSNSADAPVPISAETPKTQAEIQIRHHEASLKSENQNSDIEPNPKSEVRNGSVVRGGKFSSAIEISAAAEIRTRLAEAVIESAMDVFDRPIPTRLGREPLGERIGKIQARPLDSQNSIPVKIQEKSPKVVSESESSNLQSKPDAQRSVISDKPSISPEKNSDSHENASPQKKRDDSAQPASSNTKSVVIVDGKAVAKQELPMKFVDEQNEIAGSAAQKLPGLGVGGEISFGSGEKADAAPPSFPPVERKEKIVSEIPVLAWAGKTGTTGLEKEFLTAQVPSADHAANSMERLSKLVTGEAVTFKQSGAGTVTISLKLDSHTEISLGLANHQGQIQASIHCERGDLAGAENHWGQLQESLARHNVQLMPLQKSDFSRSSAWAVSSDAGSRNFQQSQQQHARDSQAHFLPEELPPTRLENGAFRKTKKTNSPRGWESWA